MTDDTITAGTAPGYPASGTYPDGTVYWVDRAGQVFDAKRHAGPCDSALGLDADGFWVPRPQPRRGRPRKPRAQTAPLPLVPPDPVAPAAVPARIWVVWEENREEGPIVIGAFTDPEQALTMIADHPTSRVIEASVS
jgi:hypothetical protein